ncbi:putative phage tail protein [Burkholderia cenocepacia]|uniref:putative phage tail protein n=1 Tax=Burkholderia cenocepacia TaxID=95486 RepID=UPI002AB72AF8|nr:putative phage tail protein [Burkholderia cenocepacia]
MAHKDLLALLLPPVSYDPTGRIVDAELEVEGRALDGAQADGLATLDAVTPSGDIDLLPDWERVYDLPDPLLGVGQSIEQRLAVLEERINETGRLDRDEFLFVAFNLGFSVTLNECHPYQVGTPIGKPLYGDDWMFVWKLNAPEQTIGLSNTLLEGIMRRIAPAHTVLHFNYGGDPTLFLFEEGDGFLITEDNDYLDLT